MMDIVTAENVSRTRKQPAHQHAWVVESAHHTSEGQVAYVRCVSGCAARRIDLRGAATVPGVALSKVVGR
ncbi:hypothetical protein [Arthrobacter sp. MYb227]|uniref:hypothetical protein n=1 Tax=Arthrobacter sp. MYb227 TaxID=1848601 RepID=UPI000CFBB89F|nr:hypothetical protein [Arthrobacter sp. MYb227]